MLTEGKSRNHQMPAPTPCALSPVSLACSAPTAHGLRSSPVPKCISQVRAYLAQLFVRQ